MSTISLRSPRDAAEQAVAALIAVPPVALELAERFAAAGFHLHLVGGSVRDALLGRPVHDLDFTTDARPADVQRLASGWAASQWDTGIAFGTVGLSYRGLTLEVTTYRSEDYEAGSRKPAVAFGSTLHGDLERRDFTVNAMAVTVPDQVFVDPFGGLRDLAAGVLRTPGPPERSFSEDPLRILRAGRFAATHGFTPAPEVRAAMSELAGRLDIVSPERIRDELTKLLCGSDPVVGLELLVDTGVAEVVLPELPRLKLAPDEHHHHKDVYAHTLTVLRQAIDWEPAGAEPDLVLRLAALLHDIGKPDTRRFLPGGKVSFHHHEVRGAQLARKRLTALRFPRDVVVAVEKLVALHLRFHGYGTGVWTDSAVRRYVVDAGPELDRLHALVRSDCTTRNKAKARRLGEAYDGLVARIDALAREEDLRSVRPDLDGTAIMELLGVGPGRLVGEARGHLLELRMEHGPLGPERAVAELLAWARDRGLSTPAGPTSRPAGDLTQ